MKKLLVSIKDKIVKVWQKTKDWSGWSTAGSIFMARMEAFGGFLIAVFGGLDWTPIMSLDFTSPVKSSALLGLGIAMGVKSIVAEIVRRANAEFVKA